MPRACTVILVFVAFLFASDLPPRAGLPGGPSLAFAAAGDAAGGNGENSALGYGFGAQINRPFHEVGSQALATVFFFNLSRQDAYGQWVPVGGEGCSFFVNILDEKGRLVRRPRAFCPLRGVIDMPAAGAPNQTSPPAQGFEVQLAAPIGPFPLPAGTFRHFDVPLPLAYASSQTGDPDGVPLPGGLYTLKATQLFNGPGPGSPLFMFGGGDPEARIPFRIYQCSPPAGPLPIRDLVRGAFSGYRYGDPNFFGDDLVLRTGPAGLQFWGQHTSLITPPPGPPAVDLAQEMVLVSLAGYRPSGASAIQITSVEEKVCHLEVTVWETIAPIGVSVITNPIHIVAVPRRLKEVRFIHAVELPDLPLSGIQCGEGDASCP